MLINNKQKGRDSCKRKKFFGVGAVRQDLTMYIVQASLEFILPQLLKSLCYLCSKRGVLYNLLHSRFLLS